MNNLLVAVMQYGIKFVVLAIVMIIGLNLGKCLRIKKDSKKNSEEA